MDASDEALRSSPPNHTAAIEDARRALATVNDSSRYFSDAEANLMRNSAQRQLNSTTTLKASFDADQPHCR